MIVGSRRRRQDCPAVQIVSAQKLIDKPGFSDAGLAAHCNELTVSAERLVQLLLHQPQLRIAPDEPRQAVRLAAFPAAACMTPAHQLEHFIGWTIPFGVGVPIAGYESDS